MLFSWFQNKFKVMSAHASKVTVQMLLSTMLFKNKSVAKLLYIADLDGLNKYTWVLATLSWLYRYLCRIANRNVKNLVEPLALL
ncbi:hypothetical protein Ahy_B07g088231 [Arachis hypogaea]|uniref:Aminotransferase-like plant mobile domain-containing protein n=1 Tax=Arachis hypogaea TaxID=3818 RepID=A0A444YDZ7_ARAHY|nr:hypothetical protein Ahy_B07g088231 [Arachis hypogaea]